jgi:broad specificity phosphatase PhoE
MMQRIHLIRHGATVANLQNLCCGKSDLPLSPEGESALRHSPESMPPAERHVFDFGSAPDSRVRRRTRQQKPDEILPGAPDTEQARTHVMR